MILEIAAKFMCDECGKILTTNLDPAYTPSLQWSVLEIAEDALRGGCMFSEVGYTIDGRHLCEKCHDGPEGTLRREIVGRLGSMPPEFGAWVDRAWKEIRDVVGAVAKADGFDKAAKDLKDLYLFDLQQRMTRTNPLDHRPPGLE